MVNFFLSVTKQVIATSSLYYKFHYFLFYMFGNLFHRTLPKNLVQRTRDFCKNDEIPFASFHYFRVLNYYSFYGSNYYLRRGFRIS